MTTKRRAVTGRLRQARNLIASRVLRRMSVPTTAFVHPFSHVSGDITVGDYVFVGPGCTVCPGVRIGRYTMLAAGVCIVGGDHNWQDPTRPMQFAGRPRQEPTIIGSDVWIGLNAIISRGVKIGDGAIIGAGAVVTRDIPPREVWVGVPARYIKRRFNSQAEDRAHEAMLAGPPVSPVFTAAQEPGEARHANEE